jgi:plasmid stabilization system protein ParE
VQRELSFTRRARTDIEAIQRWLTQPSAGWTAGRRLIAIRVAINRLREHRCLHPLGQHRGVRELPCGGGYRALYRVSPDTGRDETAGDVRVLRVFGPGQSRDRL